MNTDNKVAVDTRKFADNLIFTSSARGAFSHVLQNITSNLGNLNVLLPSYIGITDREGSGVFDPIENSKCNPTFYLLNDRLKIDMDYLTNLIANDKFHVLLVIHYFGICQNDMEIIRNLCNQNEIILIEDCAHAFHIGMPEQKLGIVGDYSFYSVHKYLPVKSGGILKINTAKFDLSKLDDEIAMDREVLEQIVKTDYISVANKRRENFIMYSSELKGLGHIDVMYELDENEIPQTFPILIHDNLREKLYFYLIEREFPVVALYYRMIEEIDKTKFPISYKVANDILNLPVHQDVESSDITNLCNAIKSFYTQL
jgi:dTDP-4-amino-4,6-dideoxygalactose transaminase